MSDHNSEQQNQYIYCFICNAVCQVKLQFNYTAFFIVYDQNKKHYACKVYKHYIFFIDTDKKMIE